MYKELVFVLLMFVGTVFQSEAAKKDRPNVVLIVVDDLGWKDITCFGSDMYQTPNVDALASNGVKFTNAYAACTVCSPTRASLMTGKYPAKLHCTDWIEGWKYPHAKLQVPDWTMYLDHEETSLAEVFKAAGYQTAHVGKWHLGEEEKYWPENHGFDINIGGWKKGSPNRSKKIGSKGYFAPYGNPRLTDPEGEEYLTERLADEACKFINKANGPFFLNLWFYNVHTPLQAREEKIEKYRNTVDSSKYQKNPIYAAMVEHMDDAVGRVIQQLKDLNLYENTIVIFTSDNGGLIRRGKKKATNNYPLRSGKGDVYEGGVRVPLIVRAPGVTTDGMQNSNVAISPDLMPTLIDLAHLKVSSKIRNAFDGLSLVPVLNSKPIQLDRKAVYWHYPHYHMEGATPYSAIRKGDWKLIHLLENDSYELYNLKNDIGEKQNLAKLNVTKKEELTKDLEAWLQKMNAQMPRSNPNYDPSKKR
ncbi:sulfatase [Marinifilum sp.]|uniref:sulfatase n=1 Tax=Marinifilum sp. TaxID=2033137 RepID=UPI003BAB3F9D